LRTPQDCFAGRYASLAGGNQTGLPAQFALCLQQFGLAGGEDGLGALLRQFGVGAFQGQQQLALLHMLVVIHQHPGDARAKLAGDSGDFPLHIGVVGAFEIATDEQPVGGEGRCDEAEYGQEDKQTTLQLGRHGRRSTRGQEGVGNSASVNLTVFLWSL
jgi:hypothetical protein